MSDIFRLCLLMLWVGAVFGFTAGYCVAAIVDSRKRSNALRTPGR